MANKPPKLTRASAPKTEKERKRALDRKRPNAGSRGYDAEWQRFRARYLTGYPQCQAPGCYAQATELHHIKRVTERPDLRLNPTNIVGMCKRHHSQLTALEDGFANARWHDNGGR